MPELRRKCGLCRVAGWRNDETRMSNDEANLNDEPAKTEDV